MSTASSSSTSAPAATPHLWWRDARLYLLLGVAVAVLLQMLRLQPALSDGYFWTVALNVGLAIIVAVSLNLVNGHTGQFSLGQAGFMAIGAYGGAALTVYGWPWLAAQGAPEWTSHLFFPAAMVIGGGLAALAGFLVSIPSFRVRGDYLALVTLGFGEIMRITFRNTEPLGGALGLSTSGDIMFAMSFKDAEGFPIADTLPLWIAIGVVVTVYVVTTLVNSTYGRGFWATNDDEIATASLGMNPTRYKVIAFTVGAFFAGVAGALFAHHKGFIQPENFNFTTSIEPVVMVILGGVGNTLGVVLAAIVLTLIPEMLRSATEPIALPFGWSIPVQFLQAVAEYRMVIYSLLLIVLMLVRPQGLLTFHLPKARRGPPPSAPTASPPAGTGTDSSATAASSSSP